MSLLKPTRVLHACLVTTLSFISMLFIVTYTSPIEDDIIETGILTINTYPLFGSALNIGGLFGSLIAGPVSEWLGIKTSLIIFSQLGTLGGFLLVLAHNGVSMIAARFIIGIYTSLCIAVVPLYNAEIAPESTRKFFGGIIGLAIRLGMLLSYTLGIWIGYRWLAVIYLVMVVFMNLNLVFLPESPKWLRNKGHRKKADKANEYFYDSPQEISPIITNEMGSESRETGNEISVTPANNCENTNLIQIASSSNNTAPIPNVSPNASLHEKISSYFTWPVIRPLLVCCSLQVFKSASGNEYLLLYSAHTLAKAVSINSKVAAFFYPVALLIGASMYLWIIHKVRWKRLLLLTTFVQIIANVLLSLTIYLSIQKFHCANNTQDILLCQILQIIPIPLIGIYGLAYSMGWGSLVWWLYGHILHSNYTIVSAGISNFLLYFSIVMSQLIGPIIAENFGPHILFLTFAVTTLIGFIIQLLY